MAKSPPDPTEADLQMQSQLGAILANLAVFTGFLADLASGHAMIVVGKSDVENEAATYRVVPNENRANDGWPAEDRI